MNNKTCGRCKNELPATSSFFTRNRSKSDGFHGWCRECRKKDRIKARSREKTRAAQWRSENPQPALKVCNVCGDFKPLDEFSSDPGQKDGKSRACKSCRSKYGKDYHSRNRERLNEQSKHWYYANKEWASEYAREYREGVRLEVLLHYSGGKMACQCCGESITRFLTIDHRDGGGLQHRRQIKRHGSLLYLWLKQQGYPGGYDILCFNCNCGRQMNGGVCPHKG